MILHDICIVLLNFHTELEPVDIMIPRYGESSTCIYNVSRTSCFLGHGINIMSSLLLTEH